MAQFKDQIGDKMVPICEMILVTIPAEGEVNDNVESAALKMVEAAIVEAEGKLLKEQTDAQSLIDNGEEVGNISVEGGEECSDI